MGCLKAHFLPADNTEKPYLRAFPFRDCLEIVIGLAIALVPFNGPECFRIGYCANTVLWPGLTGVAFAGMSFYGPDIVTRLGIALIALYGPNVGVGLFAKLLGG